MPGLEPIRSAGSKKFFENLRTSKVAPATSRNQVEPAVFAPTRVCRGAAGWTWLGLFGSFVS